MTNDMEPAAKLLDVIDHKTLNLFGILQNVIKSLRKLHTAFGGLGMFDLPTEQLISLENMFFQHCHISTNIVSKKLDASLGYLQLQIGTPLNPFTCENIHSWISLSGDLAFSHQQGIYGFKSSKRFLEISSRDLTSFLLQLI
jgi:hypothetical protein